MPAVPSGEAIERARAEDAKRELEERREKIATAVLAGLLANPNIVDRFGNVPNDIEVRACFAAIDLLSALEKRK